MEERSAPREGSDGAAQRERRYFGAEVGCAAAHTVVTSATANSAVREKTAAALISPLR